MRTIAGDGVVLGMGEGNAPTTELRPTSVREAQRLGAVDDDGDGDGELVMLARAQRVASDYGLTRREGEVLFELVRCDSYEEIADALGIERSTVCTHAKKVFEKTGARSRHALTLLVAFGILPARRSTAADSSQPRVSRMGDAERNFGGIGAASRLGDGHAKRTRR